MGLYIAYHVRGITGAMSHSHFVMVSLLIVKYSTKCIDFMSVGCVSCHRATSCSNRGKSMFISMHMIFSFNVVLEQYFL